MIFNVGKFIFLAISLKICMTQHVDLDRLLAINRGDYFELVLLVERKDGFFHDNLFSGEDEDYAEDNSNMPTSYIGQSFTNRKTFTCPRVKSLMVTGTNGGNLSPEDIDIVAVMGDAISTGVGLWPGTDVEFRGAVFTTGGDANIDGLVTFANILSVFNPKLEGTSHGMGTSQALPHYQFNVAESGAETDDMLTQANNLISRIKGRYTKKQLDEKWILLFITVGTEELCARCEEPNVDEIRRGILALRRAFTRLFVVLIGPVYVAKSSHLTYNLLNKLSDAELRFIQRKWRAQFTALEEEFAQRKYSTFSLLTIPMLSIESRTPELLFIPDKPLLNRRGHTYAAKWLWNRLISGSKYNASLVPLSEDSYYCPSLGCPFFRTVENRHKCTPITKREFALFYATSERPLSNAHDFVEIRGARGSIRQHWALWIAGFMAISTVCVLAFGALFFWHGMNSKKGRFEEMEGV